MSWNTPKEAVADVLSKLRDEVELIEINAYYERGQVYCTTTIKYPSGKLESGSWGHTPRCKARCDC